MWVLVELEKELPKQIGPPREEQPMVIFTDGACEDSGTSVGGVLVRPDGSTECFGFVVPEQVANSWKTKNGQSQVIGQAELFPVLVARWTWQEDIAGKRVIYFVDNESARLALVKCYSPVYRHSTSSSTAWSSTSVSRPHLGTRGSLPFPT